jgi:hypothetical protein
VVLIVEKGIGAHRCASARSPTCPPASTRPKEERRPGSFRTIRSPVEATIGTGGLPSQHGITGALIRNENGNVVRAFGPARRSR